MTLLDVYGSLYYAGARTLASLLPNPQGASAPVVVLRLRGRTALGVTSYKILTTYGAQLDEAGGRLLLSGVAPVLLAQLRRAEHAETKGIEVYPQTDVIGESSAAAYAAGRAWREARPKRATRPATQRWSESDSAGREPHIDLSGLSRRAGVNPSRGDPASGRRRGLSRCSPRPPRQTSALAAGARSPARAQRAQRTGRRREAPQGVATPAETRRRTGGSR